MELMLGVMRLINMIDGATLWMELVPSVIIGGISGRVKALLCKAHCG